MPKNTLQQLQQLREREVQRWEERGLTHPSQMSSAQFEQFFREVQWKGRQIPEDLRLLDYDALQAGGAQPEGTAVVFFEPTPDPNDEH